MPQQNASSTSPFFRTGPDALWLHMLQSTIHQAAQQNPFDVQQKIADMVRGIQKYQSINMPPVERHHDVVWEEGSARLLRVGDGAQPIVLIPSLINGWDILDLLPDHSFARNLHAAGYAVYILDFGDVMADRMGERLADLLQHRLAAAVSFAKEHHNQNVITMGYCMGGLLMAGAMPWVVDDVRANVYLATPWDFHAGSPRLTALVHGWMPSLAPILAMTGSVPNNQIQSLFAQVDPEMAVAKFSRFAGLGTDDPSVATFVAVEDWLRTGRDLPGGMATSFLQDWYLENKTARGCWRVGDHVINPKLLRAVPSLIVAPTRDQLVEVQTATALYAQLGTGADLLTPDIGHIGLMASPRARDAVWNDIQKWLKNL